MSLLLTVLPKIEPVGFKICLMTWGKDCSRQETLQDLFDLVGQAGSVVLSAWFAMLVF